MLTTGDWPWPLWTPWDWIPPSRYSDFATSSARPLGCPYCGNMHTDGAMCPRVKAIEYHPDGTVKRVELR